MEVRRGACSAYVSLPEQPEGRGVLVIHEALGLTADIRSISDRFAKAGYVALAPRLFGGLGCLVRTFSGEKRREDLDGWRAYLRQEHAVERAGIIGFCMGGGFALAHASTPGSDFKAVSVNYGAVPENLKGVCPVVGSYGERDRLLLAHAERLEKELTELHIPHDVEIYAGAGHSFLNQHSGWYVHLERRLGGGYNEQAAEDAWERIFAFFGEHV